MGQHILIIEDDPKVAESLRLDFVEAGYNVAIGNSGEEGSTLRLELTPDVLVLDFNLPGRDGIEILTTLRKHHQQLPLLILSARDTIEDRVDGLETSANDYLVRPFAFPELLARICVLLRRDQQKSIALSPGFRGGMSVLPGDAITYPMVTLNEFSGEKIKLALEDIADNIFHPGPYYQRGGDMVRVGDPQYSIDPLAKIGQHINDIHLNGKHIEARKNYKTLNTPKTRNVTNNLGIA